MTDEELLKAGDELAKHISLSQGAGGKDADYWKMDEAAGELKSEIKATPMTEESVDGRFEWPMHDELLMFITEYPMVVYQRNKKLLQRNKSIFESISVDHAAIKKIPRKKLRLPKKKNR